MAKNIKTQEEVLDDEIKTVTPEQPKTVQVPVGLLDNIKAEILELRKQNEMLLATSDKSRVAAYFSKNQQALPKLVKLRSYIVDGKEKLIMDTVMTVDQVYKDNFNRWHEDQKITLHFDDDTYLNLDYRDYINFRRGDIQGKILARTVGESDGKVMLKVERLDNGKVIEIEDMFVN